MDLTNDADAGYHMNQGRTSGEDGHHSRRACGGNIMYFYYSERQKSYRQANYLGKPFAIINGNTVEYTSSLAAQDSTASMSVAYPDMIYLGEGKFSHYVPPTN
jgi:hypothetical protein